MSKSHLVGNHMPRLKLFHEQTFTPKSKVLDLDLSQFLVGHYKYIAVFLCVQVGVQSSIITAL